MFRRRLFCSSTGIAALGAFLTLASDSLATDNKVFHATMCVQRGDTTPMIRYGFTGAVNDDIAGRWWVCPIVRDMVSGDVTDWDVTVNRHDATDAWDIRLWSCDREGDNCSTAGVVTVPASPPNSPIHVDGGLVSSSYSLGVNYLYTVVPGGAQIYSYQVDESNGTD